jgi:Cys-tRNA(Pro)/Cys-tRNA(Cys) deacylase
MSRASPRGRVGQNGRVGGSTPAIAAVVRAGVAHEVHEIRHDPSVTAYGREAAAALGVEPGRVFKTLITSVDGKVVVAVVPVTGELNLKALATALGAKNAALADRATAERSTGYVTGGISPIGQKRRLATLIDASAAGWPTVFVSGGRRGLELELAPMDLLTLTDGRLAPIGRSA